MRPGRRLFLGCITAFVAGLGIAPTVSHIAAPQVARADPPEIAVEKGPDGTLVLRPTIPGKSYAVLVESEAGSSRSEITFHQGSLTLDLRGGTARVYDLRRILQCQTDCKPCQPGPSDACIVPPVPVGPSPRAVYQVHYLTARP